MEGRNRDPQGSVEIDDQHKAGRGKARSSDHAKQGLKDSGHSTFLGHVFFLAVRTLVAIDQD